MDMHDLLQEYYTKCAPLPSFYHKDSKKFCHYIIIHSVLDGYRTVQMSSG